MKLLFSLISIMILLTSCKKDKIEEIKGPFIGGWSINEKVVFEASEYSFVETLPLEIDTATLPFNSESILIPSHQPHKVFFNSDYLFLPSNSSLKFAVQELLDGQYAFMYKSESVDLSTIKRLTTSVHAEQVDSKPGVKDYDLSLILRFCSGTDISDNYYEFELPLVLTTENNNTLDDIWPEQNFVDLDIDIFETLKARRDLAIEKQNFSITSVYTLLIDDKILRICNDPDIVNINRLCIGLKNPINPLFFIDNDGLSKSIEIWVY